MSAAQTPQKNTPSLAARLWNEYQWLAITALWVLAFILGITGFEIYAKEHSQTATVWDNLYRTLQLIPLNSGALDGPVNWQLEMARFIIPLLAAVTALKAFAALFQLQMQIARLRRIRRHVVICGLSKKGIRLARGFRARGDQVVVIERDEDNDFIEHCKAEGITVIVGDATDQHTLLKAAVQRAQILIAVTDSDGTNAEIALQARNITVHHRKDPLTCSIHIVDPQLCSLLREREISAEHETPFRLEFFNVFEHAARLLLRAYSPFLKPENDCSPHLIVVGLGKMGESLVIQAAREWRERHAQNHAQPLHISIIDLNAQAKVDSLAVRYPQLVKVCQIDALNMNIRSAAFERGEFLFDHHHKNCADVVYINLDDDSLGLHAGLVLNQRLRGKKIPVVIRMVEENGLASLLKHGSAHNGFENLHEFNVLDQTCTPDLVLGGTHEVLARAFHDEYLRTERTAGETAKTNPLLVAWEALSPEVKEANYRQADHIGIKLKAVNRGITPLFDWAVKTDEFSTDEIDLLARLEHERWREEKEHDGWSYAAGQKNSEKHTHPDLVSWDELPEPEKRKNRAAVSQIPAFLARAGLQIYRLD